MLMQENRKKQKSCTFAENIRYTIKADRLTKPTAASGPFAGRRFGRSGAIVATSAAVFAIDSFLSRNLRESKMRHFNALRTLALAIPAAAALSFNAVAQDMDETYWYASGDPTVPDGQLWVTSYGECWQSEPPDGPTNLPPCQMEVRDPLVLRLQFALDRYGIDDITNPQALAELDEYIADLKATPREERLVVGGFTDKLGTYDYNLVLSENRATTVRNYMIDQGIPAGDITEVRGFSWDVPAEFNIGDLGPLENNPLRRRVVILEVPPTM
jgi:OOP family OmpA-OmpF porin